ncbi:uncharacterized protein [Miscanthus floridulus]|uniref:uncharacterized protein isoform X1 n=1 Tax=Miscanthus floridulus TaxID=154761 RepID=UPI00345A8981
MASAEQEQETPPNRHVAAAGRLRQTHPRPLPSSWCLMDPVPLSSSSTRRLKQFPTPPGSNPGLLIDPVPPACSSGLLIDTVPPAPASTAARPPNYRRIAPIPPIRRSPPFSKRLTYLLRLGRDRDGITSSALTSSLLAGDDGHGDCNGISSWPQTSSSLATIDEIQQLTSSSSAGDQSPPPLTSSSSASDEIQQPLTISSSSVDPHPASLTSQELWLVADIMMWFRSIVLFSFAAVVIYNEHDYPAVMVSEIAGILCIYMHYWSMHITQFWLNCPHNEDSSILVWLCFFFVFMVALIIGLQHSVLAGMCITLVPTMCMAGYLISCIHEYNCTRCRQNLEQPLDSDLHQDEHTQDS